MKKLLWLTLCLLAQLSNAQINEQFSDGNFTQNPKWIGDDTLWTVNAQNQLQTINTSKSGTAVLCTGNKMALNTTWLFYLQVNLGANASTSNQPRVYLISDTANLKGNVNGYYFGLGESGSNDSYDLFRQKGKKGTKIIDGIAKRASYDTLKVLVKVNRSSTGLWSLYTDSTGTGNSFVLEGFKDDNTYTSTKYIGLYAKHSASKSDRFIFDDVRVRVFEIDTFPPTIQNAFAYDSLHVGLRFNEPILANSVNNASNFIINNDIGTAKTINIINADSVYIILQKPLKTGVYQIAVNNFADTAGNVQTTDSLEFNYVRPFNATAGTVIINEIFADPSPQVALPTTEFVELYNTTNEKIALNGWKYSDGTSTKTFTQADTILPKQYLILCTVGDSASYGTYGKYIACSPFPSLNNASDKLSLKNANGVLIDSVVYTDAWYGDNVKKQGGYSLERINPLINCHSYQNWLASNSVDGGTPGAENTVYNINDTASVTIYPNPSAGPVFVQFSFVPDSLQAKIISNYQLYNLIGMQVPIQKVVKQNATNYKLFFEPNTPDGIYILRFKNIGNCQGFTCNEVKKIALQYAQPKLANVIISEIYADPSPSLGLPNAEYIELLNVDTAVAMLDGYKFTDGTSTKVFSSKDSIMPGEYIILCATADQSKFQTYGRSIACSPFPSLTNSGKLLQLIDANASIIDQVSYTDDWYRDNDKKDGGYSLERIDPKSSCTGYQNWMASNANIGGTPAAENSVQQYNTDTLHFYANVLPSHDLSSFVLKYSQIPDSSMVLNVANYAIYNRWGVSLPIKEIETIDWLQYRVKLDTVVNEGVYFITIKNITNCQGTSLSQYSQVILQKDTSSYSLIINEVLFNPYPNGIDFVELYNPTKQSIDLSQLQIANADANDSIANSKPISASKLLLAPNAYIALSSNVHDVQTRYFCPDTTAFIQMKSMPSYNDDEGTVVLLHKGKVIDKFIYSEKMHYSQLEDVEGVSLERVSASVTTQAEGNFHSASAAVGYATPGYKNSQSRIPEGSNKNIYAEPVTFSPDNDGYNDYLNIRYKNLSINTFGSITIYDALGNEVKKLQRNTFMGAEGSFTWDGVNNANELMPLGPYIILVQTMENNVAKQPIKLLVALAKRL